MGLREKQRQHTEELILRAAAASFAQRGFHGASMEEIAGAVGCAPATLYGYFKSKSELWMCLLTTRLGQYLAGVELAVEPSRGYRAGLDHLVSHFCSYAERERNFLLLLLEMLLAPSRGGAPDPEQIVAVSIQYRGMVSGLMARGIEEGILAPRSPQLLATILLGSFDSILYLWLQSPEGTEFSEMAAAAVDIFERGAMPRESNQ